MLGTSHNTGWLDPHWLDWRNGGRRCTARNSVQLCGGRTRMAYLITHARDHDEVLIDTPHVGNSNGMLDPCGQALRVYPGIPQPHCSFCATFEDDARR